MKKRNLLIVVIVVLLLLAFGVWYFLISKKSPGFTNISDNQSLGSVNLSLRDLITRGTSQVCTFSDEDVSGTIYVNGNKFREDVEIQGDQGNEATKVYTMVTDNTLYTWYDGDKEGISKSFDINSLTDPEFESQDVEQNESFDTQTPMNYNCRSWVYEADKFELPKDVKFTFLEDQIEEDVEIQNSTQCSYCYKLAGDDQTQCLSALKCN